MTVLHGYAHEDDGKLKFTKKLLASLYNSLRNNKRWEPRRMTTGANIKMIKIT